MSDDGRPANAAQLTVDGPLRLAGRIRHQPAGGTESEYSEVFLCRCGHSSNKPFCDGSHRRVGFADAGICVKPPETTGAPTDGDLALQPIVNGPLRIDGWFEMTTTDSQRFLCGGKTWLCRCGHSANKPFCDGTHKRIGFTT